MATEVVKIVDPDLGSGADYDSLYDWEAAQQGDLTVSDTIAVAKCRCTGGTADTDAVIVGGWTTSSTQYIKIWTDPLEGYRHNGTYQTGNKYRLESSTQPFTCFVLHTKIIGLQIYWTTEFNSSSCVVLTGYYQKVDCCIFRGSGGTATYSCVVDSSSANNTALLSNSLIYGAQTGAGSIAAYMTGKCYNCTVISAGDRPGIGTNTKSGVLAVKNCYAYSATGSAYVSTNVTMTTCASSDTTGSAGLQNIALNTSNFVNVTGGSEDFHIPSGSALIGAGTNLYDDASLAFQNDIDGDDRGGSGAVWDIGADQYNPIILYYRTAATPVELNAEDWTEYTTPFISLGYVQVKASAEE